MTINKDNYEEYFLLYADKELSVEERLEVEQFVQENATYKHEFDQIKKTIIHPEENFRPLDKSFLYKKVSSLNLNESNYEGIFVLYHDGELNEAEQRETVAFLETHSQLKQAFDLFGQAKIQAEIISFPSKGSLYRKVTPAGKGRVIFFRSLAAAAIAGLLLWGSLSYLDSQNNPGQLARQMKGNESIENIATEKLVEKKESSDSNIAPDSKIEVATVVPHKIQEEKKKSLPLEETNAKQAPANYALKKITKPENKPSLSVEPVSEMDIKLLAKISQEEIPANLTTASGVLSHIDIDMTEAIKEPVSIARTAVYLDVEEHDSDNYNFFNIPVGELQKTKVAIFLKKVKRIAERNDPIKRLFAEDKNFIVINK